MEALTYDEEFYRQETVVAYQSASIVLPVIFEMYECHKVIDIGSGTGAWASVAALLGKITKAVDKDVPEHLSIHPVTDYDLNQGYDCSGWDLAICLEVAEHLHEMNGPLLVRGLANASAVLFSAATPGQPGVNHINCKPHDYWHLLFEKEGLYPVHAGSWFDEPVQDFYRRNMFLYRRQG